MNHLYEVLTEDGFRDFFDISVKISNTIYTLTFDDGSILRCTESHLIKTSTGFVEARNLNVGDIISPSGCRLTGSAVSSTAEDVYDLVNVSGGNHYLTNGVTSHNCEFLTEELTLVDSAIITQAERRVEDLIAAGELIKFAVNDNRFQFFKRLVKDAIYMVGVDPCTGTGNDNGVIQVFEFPSMDQVLEYTTNTLSPQVMYTELKALLNFLSQATEEIYFSVENNGVGQGIIASYEGDLNPPNVMLVSEKGKVGVNSNTRTKLRACLQFKEAFERGKITINSPQLLTELKSFVRSQGSYAAQIGATDDRIMGAIVVFYIIQEMASTNAAAYDMVYTVASEIEERHGWSLDNDANMKPQDDSRSDVLTRFFDSLHGESNNGIIVG